ncbi:MAG TPA: threonine ammonia-lyase [Candidatus Binataceae bacterium]|nr:threonine ammonia-lyase [Candidatus Binataceae bacterium]
MTTVTIENIELARRRLAGIVAPTPLIRNATLSRMLEAEVLIKPENLQRTGSFKIRGAYNRITSLSPEQAARGVIAASAGNHGQALSFAATQAGVKATVVMPETAAITKVAATRGYGQHVVLKGLDYLAALRAAEELRERSGAVFVDAYDDPFVIAGQGTVGLEIADELQPDVVLVPVGGGGLIAGIVVALASRCPKASVIGVEAAGSPQLSLSLKRGAASLIGGKVNTIADGLATGRLGELPFQLIRDRVREVVTVDDFEIGAAVLLMLERLKLLTEAAGAAALAGAIKCKDRLKGKRVVVLVSGGNIDINLLDRIIGHGLVTVGRLLRFSVKLLDRPGELGKLLALIGETGANVLSIAHERTGHDLAIGSVQVMLELETRGTEHIESLRSHLEQHGYQLLPGA